MKHQISHIVIIINFAVILQFIIGDNDLTLRDTIVLF